MGIDVGEKNTGIALGRSGLVTPVKTIKSTKAQVTINEIVKLAIENHVSTIVVGLPLTYDGKETVKSRKVRAFVKQLRIFFKKKIDFQSEHDSTKEVFESGVSNKGSRLTKDHLAAAVILKRYFDEKI